jgi:hypothetical protein
MLGIIHNYFKDHLDMKYRKILFAGTMIILAILTVFFGLRWFFVDKTGEAGFAIVSGILIPILLHYRKKIIGINKEYLLDHEVVFKKIRCYNDQVDYAIQINIELYAKSKISAKEISLSCKEPIGWNGTIRELKNLFFLKTMAKDFLDDDLDTYIENMKKFGQKWDFPIVINKSEHFLFSLLSYVEGERLPDGWEGLRLDEWILKIVYNNNKIIEHKLKLDIHQKSIQKPTQFKYVEFSDA